MFKTYYQLVKPGIIYGNVLTTVAGFLLASHWHGHWTRLGYVVLGTALVIASACAYNNYIDRDIDKKMKRTSKRALVTGQITGKHALAIATVFGLVGFAVLAAHTNAATVLVGAIGFVDYVFLYDWAKRHTSYSTLIGSISGAMPVVAGYTTFTGRLDTGALLLFLILATWQMPHFYAIALRRQSDYAAAKLPVLPVAKGAPRTIQHIIWYTLAFLVANVALSAYGYAGYTYAVVMGTVSIVWLVMALRGLRATDVVAWARTMFLFSLVVTLVLSTMLGIGSITP